MHVLAGGLLYPTDDVKCAILFLLRQIYGNTDENEIDSSTMDVVLGKNILHIFNSSRNKQLLKNALGKYFLLFCLIVIIKHYRVRY